MLLTGARGTGKSSLVKALLNKYARRRLRLIEVGKHDLLDLSDIVDLVAARPERFIIFCDDLSFAAEEPGYQALKAVLDGSIAAPSDNVLVYATSNRRHLMPEYMAENLEARRVDEEIHPGESVVEKISLSERFGLWVSFHPFNQEDDLRIVAYWLGHFGATLTGVIGTGVVVGCASLHPPLFVVMQQSAGKRRQQLEKTCMVHGNCPGYGIFVPRCLACGSSADA